ncbi:MAG: Acyl-CoA dehydrogenase, short-chain specific (EC [uncultured Paraburkholderia sp.]|nr:MAG: Acyl-CoA dehydrogenase, short-chain specific (EC [uncultured Paraburkholderia sp.]
MVLDQDHLMVRDALRTFVREAITPHAAAWDRERTFPKDVHRQLAELGAYGVLVPEAYGGADMDALALALILEEIAAGDGGTSTAISVNNCPVCSILLTYGSDAQKRDWLTPLARGDMLGAFCLTEPQAGSDASALRTTATRDGDAYVLNGVKQFITSGKNAQVAIVMAVTDKAAGKRGISAFIVPTDSSGYVVARLEDKLGQHSSDTAQIVFEDCRVPAANLIGTEGEGYRIALSGLEGGRIGIAAQSVGMARAAFEAALSYAKERESFGAPLFSHQAVQFRLADMATQLEAARQLIWHAAAMKDAGQPVSDGSCHGEAVRVGSRGAHLFGGIADSRRLWVSERLSGRTDLSRCARVPDLRRHERHSEDIDCARSWLGVPLRVRLRVQ